MMGRKERSSPRPKKELLDQASSVETKEIRCQMPGPMDRKEIWKPKGKRKLAWSAWENLETHSFYDPIAFPDHNLEPLVITCWFQRLMVQGYLLAAVNHISSTRHSSPAVTSGINHQKLTAGGEDSFGNWLAVKMIKRPSGKDRPVRVSSKDYAFNQEKSMEDWMLLGRLVPWQSMVNHSWL